MKPIPLADQAADLDRVRSQFEQFRAERKHGTRIPRQLYDAAIELLDHYPESLVCSELRLDCERLRRRRDAASSPRSRSTPSTRRRRRNAALRPPASAPVFVEMPPVPSTAHAYRTDRTARDLRVVVEGADGLRLTLSTSADDWVRIEPFLRSLLSVSQ